MLDYFSRHYAIVNNLDVTNEAAMRLWYKNQIPYYNRELLPYIGTVQNTSILEAGCGIGGMLFYLKEIGAVDVHGIDLSPEQISVANKFVTPAAQVTDVFTFLRNSDTMFDTILMYDLLEHIQKERIIELIALAYSRLKVGGRVVVRTPNMGSISGLNSRYIDFTHETGFTAESLRQVFLQSPFQSVTVHNSYIGKKRLLAVKLHRTLLEKLYNIRLSSFVTENIICVAKK